MSALIHRNLQMFSYLNLISAIFFRRHFHWVSLECHIMLWKCYVKSQFVWGIFWNFAKSRWKRCANPIFKNNHRGKDFNARWLAKKRFKTRQRWSSRAETRTSRTSTAGRSLRCKIRYRTLVRAKSSNFRRLVLGCIEADFCNQILIFQHFSRSTRFAILRTAQISKFQQICRKSYWFSNDSNDSVPARPNLASLTVVRLSP